jgi:hypothetical protein
VQGPDCESHSARNALRFPCHGLSAELLCYPILRSRGALSLLIVGTMLRSDVPRECDEFVQGGCIRWLGHPKFPLPRSGDEGQGGLMKTDGLGKTNSSTPSRSPRPRDVRSSEVNSFAAGERVRVRGRALCMTS